MPGKGLIQSVIRTDNDNALQAVAGRERSRDFVGRVQCPMTP
jgi:hypothetical protein